LRLRLRLRCLNHRRRGRRSGLSRRGRRRRSLRGSLGLLNGGGSSNGWGRSRSRRLGSRLGLVVGDKLSRLGVSRDGDGDDIVDPFSLHGALADGTSSGQNSAGDSEVERRLHLETWF
jgi:hypothetical protein